MKYAEFCYATTSNDVPVHVVISSKIMVKKCCFGMILVGMNLVGVIVVGTLEYQIRALPGIKKLPYMI